MKNSRYEKIYHLLQVLYKYYPVGIEMMYNEYYLGYKELERISQEKFRLASEKKLEPWLSLIQAISTTSQFQVLDYSATLTPFLNGCILLKENNHQSLNFCFQLSLLAPYYTCYYRLHRYAKQDDKDEVLPINLGYTIYKNHSYLIEKELNIDIDIDDIIKNFYPEMEFFEHHFLMKYNIKQATPYSTPNNSQVKLDLVPIYEFFFGDYDLSQTLILK